MENDIRPISTIAREIADDWKKPYFGAVPYLEAMFCLDKPTDKYGFDDARSIVTYFLCNASTWRGEKAKAIKAELKKMFRVR